MRPLTLISMMMLCLPGEVAIAAADPIAYVSVFQSGEVVAASSSDGRILAKASVNDGAGIAPVVASTTAGKVYIVDGSNKSSRLRTFDPGLSLVSERFFDNRALNFSDENLLHLSSDGKWLFISTFDYPSAAAGVLIYSVEAQQFLPIGLRGRACAVPRLASSASGRIFALCPGLFEEVTPMADKGGDFASRMRVADRLKEIDDATLTPDGRQLYALGREHPATSTVMHWDAATGMATYRDMPSACDASNSDEQRPKHMRASPDGRAILVACGNEVWVLDSETGGPIRHFVLDESAGAKLRGISFLSGTDDSLVLQSDGEGLALSTVTLQGRESNRVPIDLKGPGLGAPAAFAVGRE